MKLFHLTVLVLFAGFSPNCYSAENKLESYFGHWVPDLVKTHDANKTMIKELHSNNQQKHDAFFNQIKEETEGIVLVINETEILLAKKGKSEVVHGLYTWNDDAKCLNLELETTVTDASFRGEVERRLNLGEKAIKQISFVIANTYLKAIINYKEDETSLEYVQYFSKQTN